MGKTIYFHRGDIIYKNEKPFAYVLCSDQRLFRCDHCFARIKRKSLSILCAQCQYVKYCSLKCQNESNELHQSECPIIGHRPLRSMTRLISRILLRIQSTDQQSFDWIHGYQRTWNCLIDHRDNIIRDMDAMLTFGSIIEELELLFGTINDTEQILSIYGKILINSFAVNESNSGCVIGRALYLGASIFDHSCCPDLYYKFNGLKIYFIGTRDIYLKYNDNESNDGEDVRHLYISYIDEMMPVEERQQTLRSSYYFECKCQLCDADLQRENRIVNPRLSHCVEMIEDYFHSNPVHDLIQFIVDHFERKKINIANLQRPQNFSFKQLDHQQSYQKIVDECQLLLPMFTSANDKDNSSLIRIQDFMACHHYDYNEMERLLRIYSQYYGSKHPRVLQRLWCWISLLIFKLWSQQGQQNESLVKVLRTLFRQILIIRKFLKLDL